MPNQYRPPNMFSGTSDNSDEPNPLPALPKWLTFERTVTVASFVFSMGFFYAMFTNVDKRVTKLEDRGEVMTARVEEVRSDVKVLLERTDPTKGKGH